MSLFTFLYLGGAEPTHWFTFWDHVITVILGFGFISGVKVKEKASANLIQCSVMFGELCVLAYLIMEDYKVFDLNEKGRLIFQTQNYAIFISCFIIFMQRTFTQRKEQK